jgi:hypothetical protein
MTCGVEAVLGNAVEPGNRVCMRRAEACFELVGPNLGTVVVEDASLMS